MSPIDAEPARQVREVVLAGEWCASNPREGAEEALPSRSAIDATLPSERRGFLLVNKADKGNEYICGHDGTLFELPFPRQPRSICARCSRSRARCRLRRRGPVRGAKDAAEAAEPCSFPAFADRRGSQKATPENEVTRTHRRWSRGKLGTTVHLAPRRVEPKHASVNPGEIFTFGSALKQVPWGAVPVPVIFDPSCAACGVSAVRPHTERHFLHTSHDEQGFSLRVNCRHSHLPSVTSSCNKRTIGTTSLECIVRNICGLLCVGRTYMV